MSDGAHRASNSEGLKKRDMEKLVLCSVIHFWPLYRSPNMFSQSTYRPSCVCHHPAASVWALFDFSEGRGSFQEADWTWWPHLVPKNQDAAMLACVWLCLCVVAHAKKRTESKRFLMCVFKHSYLCVSVCGRITEENCVLGTTVRGKK